MARLRQTAGKTIEEQAAAWFVRRDAGEMSAADRAALDAWLATNPAHAQAWSRLEALWPSAGTLSEEDRQAALRHVGGLRARHRKNARIVRGSSVLVAVAALLVITTDLPTRLRADAMTRTGERRDITLEDGSVIHLNTASAISIDYGPHSRTVRVLDGEAAFDVKPDPARPFVVTAADGTATAKGTAYLVRREDGGARVTVTEHRVAVHYPPVGEIDLHEGDSVRYGEGRMGPVTRVEPYAAAGWLAGKLIFEDRPLADVVAELNRYHAGSLKIIGEAARLRVSGVFPIEDPVGSMNLLRQQFGLHAVTLTDRFIVLYR